MTIIYSILTIFLFIYGFIVGKYKLFPYNLFKGIDNMIKEIVKQWKADGDWSAELFEE